MIKHIQRHAARYIIALLGIALIWLVFAARYSNLALTPIDQATPPHLQSPSSGNTTCKTLNCWAGIVPGSTTIVEAKVLLEAQYGKENVTIGNNSIEWKTDDGRGGWIDVTDQGLVREVSVGFAKDQLTVAQLIAQMGEPSFVWVTRAISSKVKCAGALLTFPNVGINAGFYPEADFVGVRSTQSISHISVLTLEQARTWSITDHYKVRWQGYGDYCAIATN